MVGSGTEYGQFDRIRPQGSDPSGSGTLGLTTPLAYPPLYLLSATTAFYYWPGRRGSVPWGEHRPPPDPWWERRPWLSPHSGCCYFGTQVSERGFSSHLSQVAGEAEKKTFLVKLNGKQQNILPTCSGKNETTVWRKRTRGIPIILNHPDPKICFL